MNDNINIYIHVHGVLIESTLDIINWINNILSRVMS